MDIGNVSWLQYNNFMFTDKLYALQITILNASPQILRKGGLKTSFQILCYKLIYLSNFSGKANCVVS